MFYRKNRAEVVSSGKIKRIPKSIPVKKIPKKLLMVGELVEFEVETPEEDAVNAYGIINSKKRPFVCATEDGKMVVIVSSDRKEFLDDSSVNLDKASNLYSAFHGADPESVLQLNVKNDFDNLYFLGWFNHCVYDVNPLAKKDASQRGGPPFIHHAKDKGDETPPAKEKPYVLIPPPINKNPRSKGLKNKVDFVIIVGDEFEFGPRGMIG